MGWGAGAWGRRCGSGTYVFLTFYLFLGPEPTFSLRFISFGLRNLRFPCVLLVLGSETYVFLAFYWFWAPEPMFSLHFHDISWFLDAKYTKK